MKTSVIIVSFNNFEETTQCCLHFLRRDPDFLNWEIIIVDNASNEATRHALAEETQRDSNITVIYNTSNLGFAAGNNIGISKASGQYIVLLNSDAFPPPGMISKLTSKLLSNPKVGMLGPVTNFAGNEQHIFTSDSARENKIEEGCRYAGAGQAALLNTYRMDFFCVAIPRRIINEIGMLDEDFGRGYFEDLDYSLRVRKAGYRLAIAEDCFIYHKGSASFDKLPRETKELMKRNRRLVCSKHGNLVHLQHKRHANLSVLKQYTKMLTTGSFVPKFCLLNRLQLAHRDLPRSPVKRWMYLIHLKLIERQLERV
jgi:GT2 family glycosyltransferase